MLFNYEGKPIPQATFHLISKNTWQRLSTADLFKDRSVVLFTVTGAFACPYSPIQLLAYNAYSAAFKANGIDEVICLSVNDPFSLASWAQAEGADQIRFIPDVTGEFTKSMGMRIDLSAKGMGVRSRRYSMLVRNGIIKKLFVDPAGFETMPTLSSAEHMLNYINPQATRPQKINTLMQMWRAALAQ